MNNNRSDIIIKIYNSYIKSSKFYKSNILEKLLQPTPTHYLNYIIIDDNTIIELETKIFLSESFLYYWILERK